MQDDPIADRIDLLTQKVNSISEELQVLHVREAVLKDRLTTTLSAKLRLLEERGRIQGAESSAIPTAVVVEPDIPLNAEENQSEMVGLIEFHRNTLPALTQTPTRSEGCRGI